MRTQLLVSGQIPNRTRVSHVCDLKGTRDYMTHDTLLFPSIYLLVSQSSENGAGAQCPVSSNHSIFICHQLRKFVLQVQEAIIPTICLCIIFLIFVNSVKHTQSTVKR